MTDTLTRKERSKRMSLIRGRDTKPEIIVRRLLHGLGYRYCLHRRDLPGTPDLVFPARSKVIFIHGCFWHLHRGCPNNRPPKSRLDFWLPKLEGNRKRDLLNRAKLSRRGWTNLVIWECETMDTGKLKEVLTGFLDDHEGT
jgi:DNA mismatch endonuclease (patch repair protein)